MANIIRYALATLLHLHTIHIICIDGLDSIRIIDPALSAYCAEYPLTTVASEADSHSITVSQLHAVQMKDPSIIHDWLMTKPILSASLLGNPDYHGVGTGIELRDLTFDRSR